MAKNVAVSFGMLGLPVRIFAPKMRSPINERKPPELAPKMSPYITGKQSPPRAGRKTPESTPKEDRK